VLGHGTDRRPALRSAGRLRQRPDRLHVHAPEPAEQHHTAEQLPHGFTSRNGSGDAGEAAGRPASAVPTTAVGGAGAVSRWAAARGSAATKAAAERSGSGALTFGTPRAATRWLYTAAACRSSSSACRTRASLFVSAPTRRSS